MDKDICRIKPPCLYDIRINNEVWQHLVHPLSNIYLYSAHVDSRPLNPMLSIRVLVAIETPSKFNWKSSGIFCQIWSSQTKGVFVVEAINFYPLAWKTFNEENGVTPIGYMFECPVKKGTLNAAAIEAVSIATKKCEMATNALRILKSEVNNEKEKKKFAVCLKVVEMPFKDASLRLIEWFEALKLLGAEQVFIYLVI